MSGLFFLPVQVVLDPTDLWAVVTLPMALGYYLMRNRMISSKSKSLTLALLLVVMCSLLGSESVYAASEEDHKEIEILQESSRSALKFGIGLKLGYIFHDFKVPDNAKAILPRYEEMNHSGWMTGLRFFFPLSTGSLWFRQAWGADLRHVSLTASEAYSKGKVTPQQSLWSVLPWYRPSVVWSTGFGVFAEVGPEVVSVDATVKTPTGSQPVANELDFQVATALGIQQELAQGIVGELFFVPYPKVAAGTGVSYDL